MIPSNTTSIASSNSTTAEWFIGIMSGTSLDGIDLAAIEFTGDRVTKILTKSVAFSDQLKSDLKNLAQATSIEFQKLGEVDVILGRAYADAVQTFGQTQEFTQHLQLSDVKAIGNHGQTIQHSPNGDRPFTWQIGDPHQICQALSLPVCYDFRRMDVAAGGQGAPLAPLFHHYFFASQNIDPSTLIILNLGGIANITQLGEAPSGFDTGPANTLIDNWCLRHQQTPFDTGGAWGAQGQCNSTLLQTLLQHPYFSQPPPKSTGPEIFNLIWLESILKDLPFVSPVDVQATLYQFTIETIALAIEAQVLDADLPNINVVVAGGGVENTVLMKGLEDRLQRCASVQSSNHFGIDPDFLEAAAFAWLARARFHQQILNTRPFTGAAHPLVLGSMILP